MLKDLEKRDAFLNENQDRVLDGLYSAYDVELKSKKKTNSLSYLSIAIISVVILLIYTSFHYESVRDQLVGIYQNTKIEKNKVELELEPESPVVEMPVVELSTQEEVIVNIINLDTPEKNIEAEKYPTLKLDEFELIDTKIEKETELVVAKKLNLIDSIKFEIDGSNLNLLMSMPYEIDYLVYSLKHPERIIIEVENAELGFPLEDLDLLEPIVAIRYSINDKKRFKLILESNKTITIKKSFTSKSNDGHDLMVAMATYWEQDETSMKEENSLIEIIEHQVEEEKKTVFKGKIIKRSATKNINAYAGKQFQEAYAAYKQGDLTQSLRKLNILLDESPGHVNARLTTAMILSEQGHFELAYSVLNEGLIQYPENVEWITVYARILLNEEKIIEASSLLDKQSPEFSSNSEYYALQAAILQKLNEHEQSAKIYRDLLQVNPLKAVWWMGLGLSLESLKRYDDALYAYQKASNNSTLALESKLFISKRINRLNNILEDEST